MLLTRCDDRLCFVTFFLFAQPRPLDNMLFGDISSSEPIVVQTLICFFFPWCNEKLPVTFSFLRIQFNTANRELVKEKHPIIFILCEAF